IGDGDGQLRAPSGIDVDASDRIFVAEHEGKRVQVFDTDGNYVTKWGTAGSGPSQFASAFGVAVNAVGQVYVADRLNHRIQKFGCPIGPVTTTSTSTTTTMTNSTTTMLPSVCGDSSIA